MQCVSATRRRGRRRPVFLAAPLVGAVLAVPSSWAVTTAYTPPQEPTTTAPQRVPAVIAAPTTTTTGPRAPAVIATPTTTTSTTTTTTTTTTPIDDIVAVTTTSTSTTTTTTTTTSTTAHATAPPATTQPAVIVPGRATTTTEATAQLATTLPSVVAATAPGGDPVPIGTWSTDPGDWSGAVLQYLADEGIDVGTLGNQAGGTPGQLLSNEGCSVQCITGGNAYPVGVGAYLEVTTAVPAFIQIEILDVGLRFGPPSAKVFGHTWPHLEPGTSYEAVARAHDAQGNMAVAAGEFTTRQRQATVTFEPTVFWFGNLPGFDPFPDHLWQLNAMAYLDGELEASAAGEPALNDDILPTAAALGLTIETGVVDPSEIEVAYVGVYDCVAGCEEVSFWDLFVAAIFGTVPPQAIPPKVEHANGVGETLFWGTVANGIQLDGYPDDATYWVGHEFTFPLSTFFGDEVGPPVYLTVDVTVEVSYTVAP